MHTFLYVHRPIFGSYSLVIVGGDKEMRVNASQRICATHAYQSGPITIKEKKNRDLLRSRLGVQAHNSLVFSLYNLLINLGILLVSRDDEEDKEKRLRNYFLLFFWGRPVSTL